MNVVTVATFDNAIEANLAKTKLDSAEIFCFLTNENLVGLYTLLSNATGGIQLQVKAEDAEVAQEILALVEPESSKVCPNCNSSAIEYTTANKDPRNWFSFLIALLFTIYTFYIRKNYKCQNCGGEFKSP